MKNYFILFLLFSFASSAWAQATHPPLNLSKPRFLLPQDKVPLENLKSPEVPESGPDGQSLDVEENIGPPAAGVMAQFNGLEIFEAVRKAKLSENQMGRYYWHQYEGLDYCHLKDTEGNHWYGWADEGGFNWVLWRGKRYWWRDSFAGHWLYFYQKVWWRAGGQGGGNIQACVDGEYYLCDSRGKVLKDMGQDGEGGIVSAPGKYRGDFKGHGHGGHGNHGAREGTAAGSAGANSAAPGGAAPANP